MTTGMIRLAALSPSRVWLCLEAVGRALRKAFFLGNDRDGQTRTGTD